MKKLAKRLGILLGIVGILFVFYLLLVKPNGFKSEEDVIKSFISNYSSSDACDVHWGSETASVCEVFQDGFSDVTLEFVSGRRVVGGMEITVSSGDDELDLMVTFIDYEPSGLRKYLNSDYYLIDNIE